MPTDTHESDVVDLSSWQSIVSGNAQLRLAEVLSGATPTLRMDYDFKGGGGFVVARRAISRKIPEDYAINFTLRGRGAVNNLEIKLVDATGQNVWRHVHKDLTPPRRAKHFKISSRDIEFAWGPLGSGTISSLGSVEFAIVAGSGGTGTLWLSELSIENCTPSAPPQLSASSGLVEFPAGAALQEPGWRPQPDDAKPWIMVDWTQARTIGGLIIDWAETAPAKGFQIAASDTGKRWKMVYLAPRAGGRRTYVSLPALHTRFLRLTLHGPSKGASLKVQSFEFSRSIPAFWNSIARTEARGWHPRWVHREQSLWTPFGAGGAYCALMNDDGMVEAGLGSFSLEPMLWIGGSLVTWADVSSRQQLLDGWMPVPSVVWEGPTWRLTIRAGASQSGLAQAHYHLENLTTERCQARLFVLLRPFQVTPPWQSFRTLGGMSQIHDLRWQDGEILVNGTARLILDHSAAQGSASFGALGFNDGFMPEYLLAGTLPTTTEVTDAAGFASGAIAFDFMLDAHQTGDSKVAYVADGASAHQRAEPAFDWGSRLRVNQWRGNGWATEAIAAALTATAHVLITRDGPALQPGPRRYTRTWIRDSAMMAGALLRTGHTTEVRDFIRWYCPFQRGDGFIPCCVDREGIDWLVEHDSHAEWLELIADYFAFTADLELVRELWPSIEKAVGFIEGALKGDGLMPISVSHEGYLAQPVHSFWDDFWTVRGLRDAAELALRLGESETAQHWQDLGLRLSASLFGSIESTRAERKLEFIPGSIEWADFDPTATANAVYLLDVPAGLNREALERTFDKYLADWRAKRSGALAWTNYTPYEIRNIGALVRLDRRFDALELLRFFLSDRRPHAWNQWPEIAWADQQTPAHLGDLPHTWISGEYVLSVRCLFAYELETAHEATVVVAAGIAPEWLDQDGVEVNAMPTRFGPLSYTLRRLNAHTLSFSGAAGFAGMIVLRPPLASALRSVTVDGNDFTAFDAKSIRLPRNMARMPIEVICITTP